MPRHGHTATAQRLWNTDRAALITHFDALSGEDRRLRFGSEITSSALAGYVGRIQFGDDAIYGVVADDLRLAGVVHVARTDQTSAEMGVSVLAEYRRKGLGSALLGRATTWARNRGITALFMHCLSENTAVTHLARKQALTVITRGPEADAWLHLAPADAGSVSSEVLQDGVALIDRALKAHVLGLREMAQKVRKPGSNVE